MPDWQMVMFYTRNALEKILEDSSVDLFITHPPYFQIGIHNYGHYKNQIHSQESSEGFLEDLTAYVCNMGAALKENGSIVLIYPNIPNAYDLMSKIAKETNLQIGKTLIWDYSGYVEHVKQTQNDFCFMFHLYKGDCYYDFFELKNSTIQAIPFDFTEHEKYKHISHIYDSLPSDLCDILIKAFSKEGDVVVDLMGGTGSVAASAKKLNREYIYNDISPEQTNIAKIRIEGYTEMYREEVVKIMSDSIDNMNRNMAQQHGMTLDMIESQLKENRPQLDHVNGMLYDLLKEYGLIR
jgi:DNA modification methylase